MSERNQAPRSGGRTADPQRPTTGRRDTTGVSRDADAPGNAGRGARRFTGAEEDGGPRRSDTRRSGMRSDDRDASRQRGEARPARSAPRGSDSVRGEPRDTEAVRNRAREAGTPRGKARDTEGVRARSRDADGVRSRTRDTDGVRAKARDTDGVRAKARDGVRAKARDTDGVGGKVRDSGAVRAQGRDTEGVRAKAREASGVRETRDRKAGVLGGRGRIAGGRKVEAPVDGAAALKLEVSAEPLRATDAAAAPRLRVAPPPPIHGGPRAPFVATVIGVVIVGVLGILLVNTKTNENSFRIADLQNQNTALENQRQDLENQVVEASSIGNLDAAARRLGLVKADDVAQIRLPDGKIINFRGPATGKRSPTAQEGLNEGTPVTDKGADNVKPADGAGR